MGVALPKPVMTKVLERYGNEVFRCGSCCINGYRENMEDAHITVLRPTWGFFGVFDGHVNAKCSEYLEHAWKDVLEAEPAPVPMSDEKMKEIALKIDDDWLSRQEEGGSTGTFFAATRTSPNTIHLQVGNVGDSRVIVCQNGKCVSMTEDHKPQNEGERRRIEDCGGRVENNRVDGSLAVSRAFGDRDYKMNVGGGSLNQKVIALADVTHQDVAWGASDFAVLCCDGVFESNFTNEQVIDFILDKFKSGITDLAVIAGCVCSEAVARGSRDNISCVIVQFQDGTNFAPAVEVIPGPFNAARNGTFRKLYEFMAGKGNMSVAEALEKRYDTIQKEGKAEDGEQDVFGAGPPADLTGDARRQWFQTFFVGLKEASAGGGAGGDRSEQLARIQMLQQQVGVPLPILLSLMGGTMDDLP